VPSPPVQKYQKLSAGASSGFDAIPFIKHACLPVRCDGKFKQVNVLVPLMARLFRVLLSESKVPACWKVAKLSPIHKKGEVLNPGNYRMIAVRQWGDVSCFRQRAERFGD